MCVTCGGTGDSSRAHQGQTACPTCAASGLVCPTCHGARWLHTLGTPYQAGALVRCADCRTPDVEAETIAAYIEAHLPPGATT